MVLLPIAKNPNSPIKPSLQKSRSMWRSYQVILRLTTKALRFKAIHPELQGKVTSTREYSTHLSITLTNTKNRVMVMQFNLSFLEYFFTGMELRPFGANWIKDCITAMFPLLQELRECKQYNLQKYIFWGKKIRDSGTWENLWFQEKSKTSFGRYRFQNTIYLIQLQETQESTVDGLDEEVMHLQTIQHEGFQITPLKYLFEIHHVELPTPEFHMIIKTKFELQSFPHLSKWNPKSFLICPITQQSYLDSQRVSFVRSQRRNIIKI